MSLNKYIQKINVNKGNKNFSDKNELITQNEAQNRQINERV